MCDYNGVTFGSPADAEPDLFCVEAQLVEMPDGIPRGPCPNCNTLTFLTVHYDELSKIDYKRIAISEEKNWFISAALLWQNATQQALTGNYEVADKWLRELGIVTLTDITDMDANEEPVCTPVQFYLSKLIEEGVRQ